MAIFGGSGQQIAARVTRALTRELARVGVAIQHLDQTVLGRSKGAVLASPSAEYQLEWRIHTVAPFASMLSVTVLVDTVQRTPLGVEIECSTSWLPRATVRFTPRRRVGEHRGGFSGTQADIERLRADPRLARDIERLVNERWEHVVLDGAAFVVLPGAAVSTIRVARMPRSLWFRHSFGVGQFASVVARVNQLESDPDRVEKAREVALAVVGDFNKNRPRSERVTLPWDGGTESHEGALVADIGGGWAVIDLRRADASALEDLSVFGEVNAQLVEIERSKCTAFVLPEAAAAWFDDATRTLEALDALYDASIVEREDGTQAPTVAVLCGQLAVNGVALHLLRSLGIEPFALRNDGSLPILRIRSQESTVIGMVGEPCGQGPSGGGRSRSAARADDEVDALLDGFTPGPAEVLAAAAMGGQQGSPVLNAVATVRRGDFANLTDDPLILLDVLRIFAILGDRPTHEATYRGIETHPNGKVHFEAGLGALMFDDLAAAEERFVRAVQSNQPQPKAWNSLAAVRLDQHDVPGAISAIERGLAGMPDDELTRQTAVKLYLIDGQLDRVRELGADPDQLEVGPRPSRVVQRFPQQAQLAAEAAGVVRRLPHVPGRDAAVEQLEARAKALDPA